MNKRYFVSLVKPMRIVVALIALGLFIFSFVRLPNLGLGGILLLFIWPLLIVQFIVATVVRWEKIAQKDISQPIAFFSVSILGSLFTWWLLG